jgi:branched-chain amino acid transport system permease protein
MSRRALALAIGVPIFVIFLFSLPTLLRSDYWIHVLILSTIQVLMAVNLRALARTGLISMGTAGFMLLGGYSSALLVTRAGFNVWLAMLVGGILAAFLALVVGYPFLRAKGVYFAILTVMMSEVLRLIAWYWPSLTGGSTGLRDIPTPNHINLFGLTTLTFESKANYYYLALVMVIVCLVILYRVEHSWLGTMWKSINENDILARSSGINIMKHKLIIFAVTAFFVGIAGGLYAHYMGTLSPYGTPGSPFSFTASIYLVIYMMVGGEAYFAGPILGAYLLTLVPELARGMQQYIPLVFGGLLIFIVFVMPEGIVGLGDRFATIYRRVRSRQITPAGLGSTEVIPGAQSADGEVAE